MMLAGVMFTHYSDLKGEGITVASRLLPHIESAIITMATRKCGNRREEEERWVLQLKI